MYRRVRGTSSCGLCLLRPGSVDSYSAVGACLCSVGIRLGCGMDSVPSRRGLLCCFTWLWAYCVAGGPFWQCLAARAIKARLFCATCLQLTLSSSPHLLHFATCLPFIPPPLLLRRSLLRGLNVPSSWVLLSYRVALNLPFVSRAPPATTAGIKRSAVSCLRRRRRALDAWKGVSPA
jgi:hypothetical protein